MWRLLWKYDWTSLTEIDEVAQKQESGTQKVI